ncbi:MAG: MBL fold metallo-hydrolase [Chlamydiales bacterium]
MQVEFLFLGTGNAAGVPMIGCKCSVCLSNHPFNQRLRPSGLLTLGNKRLLIDSGPDFRTQALKFEIDRLDGLVLTHAHFDHIAGLDELRAYYLLDHRRLPVLLSMATLKALKKRYPYLFKRKKLKASLAAQLDFQVLENTRGQTVFCDVPLNYITYEQGGMEVNGYRFGSFAYLSDIREYPKTIFQDLQGVEKLVLSVASVKPSLMHFGLEEAWSFSQKTDAHEVYFTHLGHKLEYLGINQTLPTGSLLAYDGLKLKFTYEF